MSFPPELLPPGVEVVTWEMKGRAVSLYSIGTWDADAEAFTPQQGLSVPSINVPLPTLRQVLRELRAFGYSADRVRLPDGDHDSDSAVLVERTDGETESEILERWER